MRGVTPSKERDDGFRYWEESSPTNGQEKKKCNQQLGRTRRELAGQSRASLKVHARRQLQFALALRVVLTESEDEMRSTVSVSLPNWAYVDDITIATTGELAPFVKTKLKWTLQRHGLELRSDKRAACCPTKARTSQIREEMTQFVKWTPTGIMILGGKVQVHQNHFHQKK